MLIQISFKCCKTYSFFKANKLIDINIYKLRSVLMYHIILYSIALN